MCAWNRGMWAEHIFTVRKELAWFLLDSADTVCVYGGSIECSNVYEIFRKQKKINILPQLIAPQGAIVQMRSGCTHMPPHSCPHVRITHYRRRCCLLQTHTANKRHWRQMEYDWQSGFTTKSLKSTLYPLYFYFTLNERGREWMYTPLSHVNRTRRPCDAPISTQYSSTEEKPTPGKQTHTHTHQTGHNEANREKLSKDETKRRKMLHICAESVDQKKSGWETRSTAHWRGGLTMLHVYRI